MIKFILILALTTFATIASALDITSLYFKDVHFQKKKVKKLKSVIYGNSEVGFFETENVKGKNGVKVFDFLPPSYRKPIEFYAKLKSGKTITLGNRKFKNPTPKAIQSLKPYYEAGRITKNFIMLSVSIPKQYLTNLDSRTVQPDLEKKNSNRFTFMIALNRNLEIVWAYVPHRKGVPFYSYIAFRRLDKNKYGFVLGKKDGYYASIDSQGTILEKMDGTIGKRKFPMHHDFTPFKKDEILTFSNRYAKLKTPTRKKKLFLSNTIISVNLSNNSVTKVFDFIKYMRPLNVGHWQENKFKPRWVVWDNIKADHDFVHANSIDYYPGKGVLVSLKHLDKIVLIDESFEKILWTAGPTRKDSFYAAGEVRFSHQHDAKFDANGNLVMFDNGFVGKRSRILAVKLNKKLKRAEKAWDFVPNPPLYAENRGGIDELGSDLYMAHFVSPEGRRYRNRETMDQDRIFIFNPKTKKIKCELVIPFKTRSAGYRSSLFDDLGNETYLGKTFKKQ